MVSLPAVFQGPGDLAAWLSVLLGVPFSLQHAWTGCSLHRSCRSKLGGGETPSPAVRPAGLIALSVPGEQAGEREFRKSLGSYLKKINLDMVMKPDG